MVQFAEARARWCLGKFERIHCLLEIKILPIFLTDNSGFRILVLIITSNVGFFFLLERTLLIWTIDFGSIDFESISEFLRISVHRPIITCQYWCF